jgi:hypothetical protein
MIFGDDRGLGVMVGPGKYELGEAYHLVKK